MSLGKKKRGGGGFLRGNTPPHQPISFFLRLYKELKEYFMIESCVSFLEKANDAIFILIKVHFGGLRANEPIAIKSDIEIVCKQEIIMA